MSSTTIGKAQIEVAVDASGVDVGVSSAKRSLAGLADAAAQAGARGARGVSAIGDGGDSAAKKVEQSTRSLIGSIQRTTAALEAGSKSGAEYFRVLAAQRGVDPSVLRPYLDQLEAVRARQEAISRSAASASPSILALSGAMSSFSPAANAAASSLNSVGMSARATAAAMRGVPAQFTDIITSLQGGQAPLTVLLQQGGQLKDMFGGIGPAAKALGGYIAGLISPLTLAGASVAALGVAYYKGSQEAAAYSNALILTGNAAATTTGHLQDMAAKVSAATGATVGASAEALSALAGSGRIAADGFEKFAAVAVRSLKLLDTPIENTVKQLEDLGKSPVAASVKLNEATNYLTESVYRQIKAFEDQGLKSRAAQVAQEAWADATMARLAQVEGNLGSLQRGWNAVVGAAKSAWDAMLGVGRGSSPGEALAGIDAKIKSLQEASAAQARAPTLQGWLTTRNASSTIADLEAQKSAMTEINRLAGSRAAFEQAASSRVKALAEYDAYHLGNLTKAEKAEREILQVKNLMVAAGKSEKEIAAEILLIKDKYKEAEKKGGVGSQKVPKEISDYAKLAEAISKYVAQLEAETAGEQKLTEAQKLGVEVRRKLSAAHQADLSASLEKARSLEIAIELQKLARQAEEEAAKAIQARADKLRSGAEAIVADTIKIREHTAEIGLSASAIANLKAARDADTLATMQNELALLDATGQCTAYSEALRDNIAALGERSDALQADALAQASADAAKKAQEDWKKTSATIEQSLTDALMRGFEGGKDLAKNLRDTVVNMFKTMVLRPVIQATVTGGMESLGLGGAQQGQQTVGAQLQNANSLISGVNNVFNVGSMLAGGYGALPGTLTASNVVGAFGGDALGTLIATNPQWTAAAASAAEGAVAASAAAEGAAAAAVAAEGAAATFGSAAAAAIPYVGWVVAAAGVLYSIFGGDGPGKSQGAAAYTSLSGGKIGQTDIGEGPADKYASGYQVPLNSINAAFLGAIDALGTALGRQQTVNLTSAIKARGDGKQYGGLSYSINGGQQRDFAWSYDEGDQQATAKLAAKALSEVLVEAIKASSFGEDITRLFDGLTSPESTLQMVQAVVALSKVSDQLNEAWGLTVDQAATVARLTADGTEQGRIAATAAVAQAALAKKTISTSLVEAYESISEPFRAVVGRQLPLSLKAYDEALKGVDKTTHAGIEAFSRLFALRGNLTAFVAAIDSIRGGLNAAIEDFRTPEDRIARRQTALYDAANDAGIALPSSYSALVSLADGIDYTTEAGLHLAMTLPAVVSAFKSLQEASAPIIDERKTLQSQLDDLTLTSAQLLERQRDALDASNRALFDQIQAANAAKRVADERAGLQEQLDALTLTSTQLLERQRAALDASNQSLFDQIQAATEDKRVADERQRLQDQLDQAIGDTAALRQRELEALDPSNRALQLRIYALADEKAAREADAAAAQRARDGLQSAYNQRLSDARSRLQSAYQAESSALEALTDRLSGFAQAARSLLDDLYYGASSPLSSHEQFARAQSGLAGVISRVRAADSSALPELQTFLDLSKSNSATFVDYARDFAQVSGTLIESAASAEAQAGLAKQQLAQLKKLTDGVLGVDSSVLSVAEAIAELNAVTEGGLLGVVEAVASAADSSAATIAAALASSRLPVSTTSIQTSAGQAEQPAYADNYTWQLAYPGAIWLEAYDEANKAVNQAMLSEHYGGRMVDDAYRAEIFRSYGVPGYASGGYFGGGLRLVGENGPEIEATGPARIWNASETRAMLGGGEMAAEIRALRAEVAALRAESSAENRAIASSAVKTARLLERAMPDGDAIATREAA